MEKVDILLPPDFRKSGQVKTRDQAIEDADWLGGFHLWIIRTQPKISLVFQIRSSQKQTWPGKLDVSAAGHYMAGETVKDGLREVHEEIGKDYDFANLTYLGKKVFVGFDPKGRKLQTVCDVFFIIDDNPLKSYRMQKEEVKGLVVIEIEDLLKVFSENDYVFAAQTLSINGEESVKQIRKNDFIENWDNYQYKIGLLSKRFARGEKNLFY